MHKKWSFPIRISSVNVTKSVMENFLFCAMCTIDSLYNEPRGEMENSSLHREFIIPKNSKIKKNKKAKYWIKERGEGEEKCFEQNKDLKRKSITT